MKIWSLKILKFALTCFKSIFNLSTSSTSFLIMFSMGCVFVHLSSSLKTELFAIKISTYSIMQNGISKSADSGTNEFSAPLKLSTRLFLLFLKKWMKCKFSYSFDGTFKSWLSLESASVCKRELIETSTSENSVDIQNLTPRTFSLFIINRSNIRNGMIVTGF